MSSPARPRARRSSWARTPRRASSPRSPPCAARSRKSGALGPSPKLHSSPRSPRPVSSARSPPCAARAGNGGAPRSLRKLHTSPRGTFIPRPVRLAALDRWRRSRNKTQHIFIPRALRLTGKRKTNFPPPTAACNPPRTFIPRALQFSEHKKRRTASQIHNRAQAATAYNPVVCIANMKSATKDAQLPAALDLATLSTVPSAAYHGPLSSCIRDQAASLPCQPYGVCIANMKSATKDAQLPAALNLATLSTVPSAAYHGPLSSCIRDQAASLPCQPYGVCIANMKSATAELPAALDLATMSTVPSAAYHGLLSSCIRDQAASLPCQPYEKNDFDVLPEEIINHICLLLLKDLKDIVSMKLCCKYWRQNTIRIFPADGPMWLQMTEDKMLFYREKYQHVLAVEHKLTLPDISYCSSFGHLVTLVGKQHQILVLNLITLSATTLPYLATEFENIVQAISWQGAGDQIETLVISSVAGLRRIGISVYCTTTGWVSRRGECRYQFYPSEVSAPVIKDNSAYVIGRHCHIGVCDLDLLTWKLLPAKASWTMYNREECHLLSVEGDVLAVVNDERHACPPVVLKLNEERKGWDQIGPLEGFSFFSGSPSSVAVQSQSGSCLVTLPSLCSPYSVTAAHIKYYNGHMLFVLDNCHPIKQSLHFTHWILEKHTSKSRFPSRERRVMNFTRKEMLGYGTWIDAKVLSEVEDSPKKFIGPLERACEEMTEQSYLD